MKKNILLALCCCSLLAFAGCSDDYTDATSKHIYGENENPYLKTNTNAQVITNVALEVNGRHAYVLNLSDYTNKFEELMGMSVDAAVAGLDTKATVFYPINMTRNQWLKTAYTKDGLYQRRRRLVFQFGRPAVQRGRCGRQGYGDVG